MVANGKVARRKGDFFASKSQVFGLAAPFSLLPASDRTANAARGALRRAIHALPSPLFSLPSTSSDRTANAARGALRRAIHALPSPLSSLLPTFEAHCIVSTHCPLPSSPYPLLPRTARRMPRGARSSAPSTHCPLPSSPSSLLLPCIPYCLGLLPAAFPVRRFFFRGQAATPRSCFPVLRLTVRQAGVSHLRFPAL